MMKTLKNITVWTLLVLVSTCDVSQQKKDFIERLEQEKFEQTMKESLQAGRQVELVTSEGILKKKLIDSDGDGASDGIDLDGDGIPELKILAGSQLQLSLSSYIISLDIDNDGTADYYLLFELIDGRAVFSVRIAQDPQARELIFLINGDGMITGLDHFGYGTSDDERLNGVQTKEEETDTELPVPTLTSPPNDTWVSSRQFCADVSNPDTGQNVRAEFNIDGTWYDGAWVATSGSSCYTHTTDLNGVSWYARACDVSSACSDNSGSWTAKIDTSPSAPGTPTLSCSIYTDNTWVSSSSSTNCTINDTSGASPITVVEYNIDGGGWMSNGTNLTYNFTPSQGNSEVRMRISNAEGTSSSSNTWTIKRDSTNPTAGSITTPSSNVVQAETSYNFQWGAGSDSGGSGLHSSTRYRLFTYTNDTCNADAVNHGTTTSTSRVATFWVAGQYWAKVTYMDNTGNMAQSACSTNSVTTTTSLTTSGALTPGTGFTFHTGQWYYDGVSGQAEFDPVVAITPGDCWQNTQCDGVGIGGYCLPWVPDALNPTKTIIFGEMTDSGGFPVYALIRYIEADPTCLAWGAESGALFEFIVGEPP